MADNWVNILLIFLGAAGWLVSAGPVLKYMIYLSEKDFRWPLVGWFSAITCSIFMLKLSLFASLGWPEPNSWSSRFFFPILLFASPLVPITIETIKSRKK